ncbi:MAG: 2-oxo-hepta-3-ene-1,7-dioic acid hydratase [Hyphomicrobiales bacterium]|nr:2-oxo-hepta-3-ene-1,7-dioic acid hydratase [Hyphomicrobiales bacterium]
MSQEDIEAAARDLLVAEKTRKQTGLISLRFPHMDMNDAYAIQGKLVEYKIAEGSREIGWKIGLTSKAMQSALNIDIPDSGVLLDHMQFDNASQVPKDCLIQPRIEAEIAFIMKKDLAGEHVTRDDVLAATQFVAPSIEILDTRIYRKDPDTGQARNVFDTISDNAANAGLVLGEERHHIEAFDPRWVGVIVFRDGEVEETGLGAGVLNDPVEGIVWLARRMAKYHQTIKAGQTILSGSFVRPVDCISGSEIKADFGSFGSVEIAFG